MMAAALVAAAVVSCPVHAQTPSGDDLESIRRQLQELKQTYETRIQALEARLKAAEEASRHAERSAAQAQTRAENAEVAAAQAQPQPVQAQPNKLNPAISLILNGTWGRYGHDPSSRVTGFAASGGEVSPPRGASLGESELAMSGNVDPFFRGSFRASLAPEGGISVEEAFFETLALGNGFTIKGGRFFSGLGYQNAVHPHAWDFADASLVQRVFLGTNYGDDGIQLRYLPPLPVYLQLGAEIGRGRTFAGVGDVTRNPEGNGRGSEVFFAHLGDDIGDSHSYQVGVSHLRQESGTQGVSLFDYDDLTGVTNLFSGTQHITGVDFVYKWAPEGNPVYRNFKFATEWFQRRLDGRFAFDTRGINSVDGFQARQSGWYAQAVYQFMPYWRTGLRFDRLSAGSVALHANAANLTPPAFDPRRWSVMVDWSPSEFSRVRLQYNRDETRENAATGAALTDNQIFLQYVYSLGAHGAHKF
ncbi:MAG: hypothetical protein GC151_00325 [Betaproteobacteria bacterium]|nr:hypothetical protein [Betaproteobacteria bacterium]